MTPPVAHTVLRYKAPLRKKHPSPAAIGEPRKKAKPTTYVVGFVLALPIFPGRLQPSIVSRSELNFRVRDGNGWTLALISTNFYFACTLKTEQRERWEKAKIACMIVGQALGLLVPVSCMHYCTSTSGLSTRSSFWALTP